MCDCKVILLSGGNCDDKNRFFFLKVYFYLFERQLQNERAGQRGLSSDALSNWP